MTVSHALPGFTVANPSDITAQTTKIGDSGWQLEGGGTLDGSYTAVKNALQSIPASKHIVLYSINALLHSHCGCWNSNATGRRIAPKVDG